MIKRTIFVESPSYLSIKNRQLEFSNKDTGEKKICPMEDLGFLVIENHRTTLNCGLLGELAKRNTAVILCDSRQLPQGLLCSINGNHLQAEVFRAQVEADLPLKKRLWKQTVERKIYNQMALLTKLKKKVPSAMKVAGLEVKSGDSTNREALAARFYWQSLFGEYGFKRSDYEKAPNPYLNYGYAILRGAVARALVGSGLNLTLSIHHSNKYNGFGLVDDIMEAFRPFVDETAYSLFIKDPWKQKLERPDKEELLKTLVCDVFFRDKKRPLMNGLSLTSASLARCLKKEEKAINYPEIR